MRISDWSSDVCSSDLERTTFFDIASCTEETLRTLERISIDTTGQHLTGTRHNSVVGATQARNGVQKDHYVLLVLEKALGFFDHHFGDLDVTRSRFVESGANKLPLHDSLHIGYLLRPLAIGRAPV